MFGENPRLSEILARNAKTAGFGGAIFSNDPNIGIRMMGKEAFIPPPINSLTYHPERTAAINRERKKWYANTPSFTPSQVLQGAKQGYPSEPTREDIDDTRPEATGKKTGETPKPVVEPPEQPKPAQPTEAEDPFYKSWAAELPDLYKMYSDQEIQKNLDQTKYTNPGLWYQTAKKVADKEMAQRNADRLARNPPKPPELIARQDDNRAQKPGIPETIERPSELMSPTGQMVPSDFRDKARQVSPELYENLSKHGPAFELLSQEERQFLMNKMKQEEEAERTRQIEESARAATDFKKREMIRNFMRMMNRQLGVPDGTADDYEFLRDQSLAGSVDKADLDRHQEARNFTRSLNTPIDNFSEYYPFVSRTISDIFGGLGAGGRALARMPSDLNESLSRMRDRGF